MYVVYFDQEMLDRRISTNKDNNSHTPHNWPPKYTQTDHNNNTNDCKTNQHSYAIKPFLPPNF